MQRVLTICGPTASGKTALAVELAEKLGAEIVSADSQQCYRGLDAGTAKPTPQERARAPHRASALPGADLVPGPAARGPAGAHRGAHTADVFRWLAAPRDRVAARARRNQGAEDHRLRRVRRGPPDRRLGRGRGAHER